jgi:hypothetical protein
LGHVERKPKERDIKKLTEAHSLKASWTANVMKDIQAMKIVNRKGVYRIEINGRQLLSKPKLIYRSST